MKKTVPSAPQTTPKRVSPEILEELHMLSALSGKSPTQPDSRKAS
jgi:hypothetical protein